MLIECLDMVCTSLLFNRYLFIFKNLKLYQILKKGDKVLYNGGLWKANWTPPIGEAPVNAPFTAWTYIQACNDAPVYLNCNSYYAWNTN
jgi:hypothetical protein